MATNLPYMNRIKLEHSLGRLMYYFGAPIAHLKRSFRFGANPRGFSRALVKDWYDVKMILIMIRQKANTLAYLLNFIRIENA